MEQWEILNYAMQKLDKVFEEARAKPPAPKIITVQVYPPIPIRTNDWCAYRDGYEPGNRIGWGETEAEAIKDLEEQYA